MSLIGHIQKPTLAHRMNEAEMNSSLISNILFIMSDLFINMWMNSY